MNRFDKEKPDLESFYKSDEHQELLEAYKKSLEEEENEDKKDEAVKEATAETNSTT